MSEDPGVNDLNISISSAYFWRRETVKKYLARSNMLSSGKDRDREGKRGRGRKNKHNKDMASFL